MRWIDRSTRDIWYLASDIGPSSTQDKYVLYELKVQKSPTINSGQTTWPGALDGAVEGALMTASPPPPPPLPPCSSLARDTHSSPF
jgi:hypothetical protein